MAFAAGTSASGTSAAFVTGLSRFWLTCAILAYLATFAIGFCMLFALVATFSYITFYLSAAPFHFSSEQLSYLSRVSCGLGTTLVAGTVLTRVGLRVGMMAAIAACMAGVGLTLVPFFVDRCRGVGRRRFWRVRRPDMRQ